MHASENDYCILFAERGTVYGILVLRLYVSSTSEFCRIMELSALSIGPASN